MKSQRDIEWRLPSEGTWTNWHPVRRMLNCGEIPTVCRAGAYAFRVNPASRANLGDHGPLVHVGGMSEKGTLYSRIGSFIGAGLGRWDKRGAGPSHSGGLSFSLDRLRWKITVLELDLAFVIAPTGYEEYCAEVAAQSFYADRGIAVPGNRRHRCGCHGRHRRDHQQFKPPPLP
jgi:hypothetical protein